MSTAVMPGCAGCDPELWFSDDPQVWPTCRAICGVCPVREACLLGAVRRREPCGMWGGVRFPARFTSCEPVAGVGEWDEPVWWLQCSTRRGTVVGLGPYSRRVVAEAVAEKLLSRSRRTTLHGGDLPREDRRVGTAPDVAGSDEGRACAA